MLTTELYNKNSAIGRLWLAATKGRSTNVGKRVLNTTDIPKTVNLLMKLLLDEKEKLRSSKNTDGRETIESFSLRVYGILLLGLTILQDGKAKLLLSSASKVLKAALVMENMRHEKKVDVAIKDKSNNPRGFTTDKRKRNKGKNKLGDFTAALSQITYRDIENEQKGFLEDVDQSILDDKLFDLEELEMALDMGLENTPDFTLPGISSLSSLSSLLTNSSTLSRASPGVASNVLSSILNETLKLQGESTLNDFLGDDIQTADGYDDVVSMSPGLIADSLLTVADLDKLNKYASSKYGKGDRNNERKRKRGYLWEQGNGVWVNEGTNGHYDDSYSYDSDTQDVNVFDNTDIVGLDTLDKTLSIWKDKEETERIIPPKSKRRPSNVIDRENKVILSTTMFRRYLEHSKQAVEIDPIMDKFCNLMMINNLRDFHTELLDSVVEYTHDIFARKGFSSSLLEIIDNVNSKLVLYNESDGRITTGDKDVIGITEVFEEEEEEMGEEIMRGEDMNADLLIVNSEEEQYKDYETPGIQDSHIIDNNSNVRNTPPVIYSYDKDFSSIVGDVCNIGMDGDYVFGKAEIMKKRITRKTATKLFQGLLRKAAKGEVVLKQNEVFGPISIKLVKN